jgi:predicted DNA-binding mobile mystery protein A
LSKYILTFAANLKAIVMRNQKKLLIEQLDNKLKAFTAAEKVVMPDKGWIHTIRKSLNMTLEQLGKKLNLSKNSVREIEEREASESITIKSLRAAANALDMQLVYGFVPKNGSISALIDVKAKELARKIVLRTNHNMQLENQGNSENQIQQAIEELTVEIKREMPKSLWD